MCFSICFDNDFNDLCIPVPMRFVEKELRQEIEESEVNLFSDNLGH